MSRNKIPCIKKESFCCLGVACVINGMTPNKESGFEETCENFTLSFKDADKITGFKTDDGHFNVPILYKNQKYECLTDMNDTGMSFSEIADVIEKVYEEL